MRSAKGEKDANLKMIARRPLWELSQYLEDTLLTGQGGAYTWPAAASMRHGHQNLWGNDTHLVTVSSYVLKLFICIVCTRYRRNRGF